MVEQGGSLHDFTLMSNSYGEEDEPAPQVKEEPVKSEPEPATLIEPEPEPTAPVDSEPQVDPQEPELAQGDTQFKAEPEQGGFQEARLDLKEDG